MKRIVIIALLFLIFIPASAFALNFSSLEPINEDVDGNKYFIDKSSAYIIKGKKGDKEFKFSVIVVEKYSDFGKVKLSRIMYNPQLAAYAVDRITFRHKKDEIGFRSEGGAIYDSSGNMLKVTGHWNSFSKIKSSSV